MADAKQVYKKDQVDSEEKIVRFILFPRDWDKNVDELADNFVKLRKDEKGVSCIRHDLLGGEEKTKIYGIEWARGITEQRKTRNANAEEQTLKGWGHCSAQQIIDLDPSVISLYIDKPEEKPEHVEIRFAKEGELVLGIVKDAYILELFDKIEETFDYLYFDVDTNTYSTDFTE